MNKKFQGMFFFKKKKGENCEEEPLLELGQGFNKDNTSRKEENLKVNND